MERLWRTRDTATNVLHLGSFEKLGGAKKIAQDHFESAIQELPEDEQQLAATVFGYLVTPAGRKIALSANELVRGEYSAEQITRILEKLATLRILRTVEPSRERPNEPRYEIYHDVLAASILRWVGQYEQAEQARRREQELEKQRAEAEKQLEYERVKASEDAARAGEAAMREQLKLKQEANQRQRWLLAGLGVVAVVAFVSALFAFNLSQFAVSQQQVAQTSAADAASQAHRANEQADNAKTEQARAQAQSMLAAQAADTAEAAGLESFKQKETAVAANATAVHSQKESDAYRFANLALQQLPIDFQTSLHLAYDAVKSSRIVPEAVNVLATVLQDPEQVVIQGGSEFNHATFSGDGQRVFAFPIGNPIQIWDLAEKKKIPSSLTSPVFRAAASPDGKWIAGTGSLGISSFVLDAKTGERVKYLESHQKIVYMLHLAPIVTGLRLRARTARLSCGSPTIGHSLAFWIKWVRCGA